MDSWSILQLIPNNVLTYFSGTWETKVSNKEKREQRKKDKNSSDGSASPGGGGTPVSAHREEPKAPVAPVAPAAPAPANQKKKKGSFDHVYYLLGCDFLLPRGFQIGKCGGVCKSRIFSTCIDADEAQNHCGQTS